MSTPNEFPSSLDDNRIPNESTMTPSDLESPQESSPSTFPPEVEEPLWPREWRAYLSLAGCFFLMFNSWGLVNAYGTFSSYYKDTLLPDHDSLLFNLIGSTQCFWVLLFSGFVGRVFDANHCKHLIGVGAFLVTLGMMLLSVVNGDGGYNDGRYGLIWLTQGLITGVGMACFFVTSSAGKLSPLLSNIK
jgi:MFS transporter, MCT family, solute carrier family 16 (monocarboxylic acid transporters), member 10